MLGLKLNHVSKRGPRTPPWVSTASSYTVLFIPLFFLSESLIKLHRTAIYPASCYAFVGHKMNAEKFSVNHRLDTSQGSDKIGLHRYDPVQLLIVTAQGRICANRFYHSLGRCEACAVNTPKPIFKYGGCELTAWGSVYKHGLTLILTWVWVTTTHPVKYEMKYAFSNFNGCTVEAWEWISKLSKPRIGCCHSLPPGSLHALGGIRVSLVQQHLF